MRAPSSRAAPAPIARSALYRRAIDDGIEREQALRMVVDQLIAETQTFE